MTSPVPEKTFILIGHPVAHSLSPAIHEAAYAELGLSGHRYVTADCPNETAVRAQFKALRRGELAGANVTVPWKRLALELSDELHASAKATRAVNVLRAVGEVGNRGDGTTRRIVAHNTDVPALAAELLQGRPGAGTATILGNGGAALAAVAACLSLGVTRPFVTARRWKVGNPTGWERADEFMALGACPVAWPADARPGSDLHRAIVGSDLVVQSTSDGMHGASDGSSVRDVVPWADLDSRTFTYDVVYNPAETPFLRAARAHALPAEGGLGMLVRQAALAVELWLGQAPPLAPLTLAAHRALAEKMRA
jgi:shikimate dehydrogenase